MATGDDAPTKRELPAGASRPREADITAAAPAAVDARFETVREIGRGGMGRVIEARDIRLDRIVAVKESLDTAVETRARFEREVAITARLEHPSIVPLYDAGTAADGTPYYVMRKVAGERLDHLIQAAPTLDARLRLLPNMLAVADAVAHAHARGVIHRDLKPTNVLVGEHGETILIDWGLAKTVEEGELATPDSRPRGAGTDLTTVGSVVGTPGFLAPEQCRGEGAGLRSDVYALGATLYYLLAGRMAVQGDERELLERAEAGAIDPLDKHAPGLAPDLTTIVMKAMAREASQRYADAAGFAEDLRRFLGGQLVASHHYPPLQRLARWIRKNRAVVAASVIGLAVAVAIGVVALRRIFAEQRRTEAALQEERERADELLITQAYALVERDPTRTVATLKSLRPESPRWSSLGPLLAEARMRGVAVGYRGEGIGSVWFSREGDRVVTSGHGTIYVHDLRARTSMVLADGNHRKAARWVGSLVVLTHLDGTAAPRLIDPKTRTHHDIAWPSRINSTTAGDGVVAFVDSEQRVITLDVAGLPLTATPALLPGAIAADDLHMMPSGRWLVVRGRERAQLFRRDTTWQHVVDLPYSPLVIAVDADERRVAFAYGGGGKIDIVELELTTQQELRRWQQPLIYGLAYADELVMHNARQLLILRDGGKVTELGSAGLVSGFGLQGNRTLAAALDSPRHVRLRGGSVETAIHSPVDLGAVFLDPRGGFLVGVATDAILAWDLTQIVSRYASVPIADALQFVTPTAIVANGMDFGMPAQSIMRYELATPFAIKSTASLGRMPPMGAVIVMRDGTMAAADRSAGRISVAVEALSGRRDLTAVDVHGGAIVLGTAAGGVERHDRATGATTKLFEVGGAINWIDGVDDWIVATAMDGYIYRRHHSGHVQRWRLADAEDVHVLADGTTLVRSAMELHTWPVIGAPYVVATFAKRVTGTTPVVDDGVVLMTQDGAVHLYDPRARSVRPLLNATQSAVRNQLSVSGDGKLLAVREGMTVRLIDLVRDQSWLIADRLHAHALALSPDGSRLVAGLRRDGGELMLHHFDTAIPEATAGWLDRATNAKATSSPRAPLAWQW